MTRIAVLGSLNMDLVAVTSQLPLPGETVIGTRFFTAPGGKGANQAYAAASLGGNVAMFGRIGADDHGRQLLASLRAVGCDVGAVQAVDAATGVAAIIVSEAGENAIVIVPGANAHYRPQDIQAEAHRLQSADFVLLQLETPLPTVIAAAHTARGGGATVLLDPAPAPDELPHDLLSQVDILTPNETEACHLLGRRAGALGRDEAPEVASQLLQTGVAGVVLKLGPLGCLAADARGTTWIDAPRVQAVDSTAAGDVFNGALAVACCEGASLSQACEFAVQAAALSVTRYGAQPAMPTRAQVEAFRTRRV